MCLRPLCPWPDVSEACNVHVLMCPRPTMSMTWCVQGPLCPWPDMSRASCVHDLMCPRLTMSMHPYTVYLVWIFRFSWVPRWHLCPQEVPCNVQKVFPRFVCPGPSLCTPISPQLSWHSICFGCIRGMGHFWWRNQPAVSKPNVSMGCWDIGLWTQWAADKQIRSWTRRSVDTSGPGRSIMTCFLLIAQPYLSPSLHFCHHFALLGLSVMQRVELWVTQSRCFAVLWQQRNAMTVISNLHNCRDVVAFILYPFGQTTVNKWAPVHHRIPENDMVNRPL